MRERHESAADLYWREKVADTSRGWPAMMTLLLILLAGLSAL
jgi:hypothetical protein